MSEKVQLASILGAYSDARQKAQDWGGHDRLDTVGASEAFACVRMLAYEKSETPPDTDYQETRGAMDRGNLIEDHWIVPALRDHLPDGIALHGAGEDQKTWVAGWLSCTPDAILTNETEHEIDVDGIVILPGQSMLVEMKSIDPRVDLSDAKMQHQGQVQVQAGIVAWASNYSIVGALLIYVNASFLDDITIFPIGIEPDIYETAVTRAEMVFGAISLDEDDTVADTIETSLKPEGKIAGGKECTYCAWFHRCQGANVDRVPDATPKLMPDQLTRAAELVNEERLAYANRKEAELLHKDAQQKIKDFMADIGTNSISGPGWSIRWTTVKGRKSYDVDAMADAGIDVEKYTKVSAGSDRLTVKGAIE